MAELIAAYSPPMPAPVRKRQRKKNQAVHETAVSERGGDVEAERDQEELLAAEAVGELAEEERADAGSGDVDGGSGADLRRRDRDPAARLRQARGDRADDRHLEAVEDPDRAEADHDEPVEPRPGQPVEASRDVRLDTAGLDAGGLGAHLESKTPKW